MARSYRNAGGCERTSPRQPFRKNKRPWLPVALIGVLLVVGALVALQPGKAKAPKESAQTTPGTQVAAVEQVTNQPSAQDTAESVATVGQVVQAEDGVVRLPVADLADGRAAFYTYRSGDKTIPFFALRSSDGVIRAAFDACDVCYLSRKGYHQEGDEMVCNNCGSRFPSTKINEIEGGCNPAPLDREVQGDMVVIRATDLENGARFF